jgi:hypothetical protein
VIEWSHTFAANGRVLVPLSSPVGHSPGIVVGIDRGGDLGGGTVKFEISLLASPDVETDNDWIDFGDGSESLTTGLSVGNSYVVNSMVPSMAISLSGATAPSFTVRAVKPG